MLTDIFIALYTKSFSSEIGINYYNFFLNRFINILFLNGIYILVVKSFISKRFSGCQVITFTFFFIMWIHTIHLLLIYSFIILVNILQSFFLSSIEIWCFILCLNMVHLGRHDMETVSFLQLCIGVTRPSSQSVPTPDWD